MMDHESWILSRGRPITVLQQLYSNALRRSTVCVTHSNLSRHVSSVRRNYTCQVDFTVEHILFHCTSFKNARDDFCSVTLISMIEFLSKVFEWILSKKLDFIVKLKCMFFLNFNYWHASFHCLHIICFFPIYQQVAICWTCQSQIVF